MKNRACNVCDWKAPDGYELPGWCARCRGRTIADVADLPELYRTLDALLAPGSGGAGKGDRTRQQGKKQSSPLPVRLDALNLRGPATVGTLKGADQHGALSIATVLWGVRQAIREACRLPAEMARGHQPVTVDAVERDTNFALRHLDLFAETAPASGVHDIATILQDTRRRAWVAVGYPAHKILLGPCPQEIDRGLTCGRELWVDPVLDSSVTCRDCGKTFDRRYFLWLRRMRGEM